jgi:tetratricopeptide (TPR) repeat protein
VSADPLSPERGSYQFAQQMLRQVAYDTLSRRDRKARHLTVATHLRAAFPGDGEEVIDVIARHYLDALQAVPDDADAGQIRSQAITALIRAGERAERTGAPARAAASYATAAELTLPDTPEDQRTAGELWEHAAQAAVTSGDWAAAVAHGGRARDDHVGRGQDRAAARAQVIAGEALYKWGRFGEARGQLTAAVEVLRAEPDTDTVRALEVLAIAEVFAGSPDADRLSAEALNLGEALDVGAGQLDGLFLTRAIYLRFAERRFQAVAHCRESVRLASQTGDTMHIGRALLNLADALAVTDPAAAVEAARTAAGHLRRAGARDYLAFAIMNLVQALLMLGEWDAALAELTQATDTGGLADIDYLACQRGWVAALRGDTGTAATMLAGLRDLAASEDPQDKAMISTVEALTAAAGGQPRDVLRHARATLTHAGALGISHESLRWAWPLAARAAFELRDTAAVGELLARLDAYRPGHLVPMLRAERDLVRARVTAADGAASAAAAFAAAIAGLRERSTPYHLAHGLLDHAQYLLGQGDVSAAALTVEEARDIGDRLRCQPLLDRAANLDRATAATAVSRRTPT